MRDVRTPAHLAPWVDVLGPEGAEDCFLTMGGKEVYLSERALGRSELAQRFGVGAARALAARLGVLKIRVPTPKRWLAAVMHQRGLPVSEIAVTLRISDVAVRKNLARDPAETAHRRRASDDRQMTLL